MTSPLPYPVQLAMFEGPLDLLLYLIRKQELDIYDIPIAKITEQYTAYLNSMEKLNLEAASEYILMAATLIYIKSRMLLPRLPLDDAPPEDPREGLVERLLEYEKYKKVAKALEDCEAEHLKIHYRGEDPSIYEPSSISATVWDLTSAFKEILKARADNPITIRHETYSIEDKCADILERLAKEETLSFRAILLGAQSVLECVVYFLALLELIRIGSVRIFQGKIFGEILIYLNNVPTR